MATSGTGDTSQRRHSSGSGDGRQWRESATRAATRAYEAAYGREIPDQAKGVRWSLEPRVAATALVAILLAAGVLWLGLDRNGLRSRPGGPELVATTASAIPGLQETDGVVASPPPRMVIVHVAGAVHDAGLVELPEGARVHDAIQAAGGPSEDADLAAVNLAREAHDGEQIRVPALGEHESTGGGHGSGGGTNSGMVSLNSADAVALTALPGVGPVLAERIVADREAYGPFASLEDLARVSGVGPAIVGSLDGIATL